MSSIFLSHNSKDKRFVRRLGKLLLENGVKVWIDEAEIKLGDSLVRKISEGIKDMEFLGVVLTPNSVSSNWVQKELEIATTMEIQDKKIKVIPILYKDCEIPLFLMDKVYADFRNRKMFQHSFMKLLDALLPYDFREEILSVVKKAIQAEFSAYKSLPDINLNQIDKYFNHRSSARARIIHLLNRHHQRGWVINNLLNPSTYEILDIKLKKIESNKATVMTEEYWYLRWYDTKTSEYVFVYNEKNTQTYILEKDKYGIWRVNVNIYKGPEYVSGLNV
jgi:hypothetical protein